jgi:hypothetical protein
VKNNGPGVKKLSNRYVKMVCLGYAEGTKGYKMYDPVAKRVHLSRDVIFEENRGWDWNTDSDIQNRPDFFITETETTVEELTTCTESNSFQAGASEPASPPSD